MRVLFLASGDVVRASSRYRVYNVLPHLEDRGVDCEVVVKPDDEFLDKTAFALRLASRAARCDVLYIERVLLPPWYLRFISRLVDAVVYDFDDALYASPPGEDPVSGREEKLVGSIQKATLTITGIPVLSEYAEQYTDRVKCLPTAIPRDEYNDYRRKTPVDQQDVTLGWIGIRSSLVEKDHAVC